MLIKNKDLFKNTQKKMSYYGSYARDYKNQEVFEKMRQLEAQKKAHHLTAGELVCPINNNNDCSNDRINDRSDCNNVRGKRNDK